MRAYRDESIETIHKKFQVLVRLTYGHIQRERVVRAEECEKLLSIRTKDSYTLERTRYIDRSAHKLPITSSYI